jgi:hypothetical protein
VKVYTFHQNLVCISWFSFHAMLSPIFVLSPEVKSINYKVYYSEEGIVLYHDSASVSEKVSSVIVSCSLMLLDPLMLPHQYK